MPEQKVIRCKNCGHEWQQGVSTQEEKEEAKNGFRQLVQISCEKCQHTDLIIEELDRNPHRPKR